MKILFVVGARPNFMKLAPIIKECEKKKIIKFKIVHTGQHYDDSLSKNFFLELKIPSPDYNLNVGSATHAIQTAKVMIKFEKICLKEKPDYVFVFGDINSTLAGAIVASKLGIKLVHVESGLRSFNMSMPEEINRILTDHVSDFLFITEPSALVNLLREGISKDKIFFVGNTMINNLINNFNKEKDLTKEYGVITIHRPINVDNKKTLLKILKIIDKIQKKIKIIFPVHPRTMKNIKKFKLLKNIKSMKNVVVLGPLNYLSFIELINSSKFVLTDSGGVQEETTFLGIPCLTMREETERPVTIDKGTNVLVKVNEDKILNEISKILSGKQKQFIIPTFWDNLVSKRIMEVIEYDYKI